MRKVKNSPKIKKGANCIWSASGFNLDHFFGIWFLIIRKYRKQCWAWFKSSAYASTFKTLGPGDRARSEPTPQFIPMADTYLNCGVIVGRWLKELEIVPGWYLHKPPLCNARCVINHEMIPITTTISRDPPLPGVITQKLRSERPRDLILRSVWLSMVGYVER